MGRAGGRTVKGGTKVIYPAIRVYRWNLGAGGCSRLEIVRRGFCVSGGMMHFGKLPPKAVLVTESAGRGDYAEQITRKDAAAILKELRGERVDIDRRRYAVEALS